MISNDYPERIRTCGNCLFQIIFKEKVTNRLTTRKREDLSPIYAVEQFSQSLFHLRLLGKLRTVQHQPPLYAAQRRSLIVNGCLQVAFHARRLRTCSKRRIMQSGDAFRFSFAPSQIPNIALRVVQNTWIPSLLLLQARLLINLFILLSRRMETSEHCNSFDFFSYSWLTTCFLPQWNFFQRCFIVQVQSPFSDPQNFKMLILK